MGTFTADNQSLILESQEKVLELFRAAASRVPAYRDFLTQNNINPDQILTIDDFVKLPVVNKENYLRKYPLKDLVWDGNLHSGDLISVSSGTSGNPFFWLRGQDQHKEAADIYEEIYSNIFGLADKSTLLVVCFSMGTWIAGSYTTLGAIGVTSRGYDLNIITPALEKKDAITAIKDLAKNYNQVILAGYPPFIKDLIDYGFNEGLNWKDINLRFTFAGESITEEWRDHILSSASKNPNPYSTVNIYGTADAGILGHETPLSISIRRAANLDKTKTQELFGASILPTLVQYDPRRRYIEIVDDQIIFSCHASIPLIRYNIRDTGGIYQLEELTAKLDISTESIPAFDQYKKMPFVYLHGRSDFTVTIYAVLVYPENIKTALHKEPISKWLSGKFSMATKYEDNMDQYFEINLELKDGVKSSDVEHNLIQSVIISTVEELNAEYRKLRSSIGERSTPKIILRKNSDPEYFPSSNKHKWVLQ